jgi:DNA polymerase-3 subunit alpha
MNRRALEGLASSGAFDMLEPNRAKVMANADMLLAVADEAERTRTSGQGGLFGGDGDTAALRLTETPPGAAPTRWARSARTSASISPLIPWSNGTPSPRQWRAFLWRLMSQGAPPGGRAAVMACMVESVQKRKTKRGKDFIMAEFSDPPASSPPPASRKRWSSPS